MCMDLTPAQQELATLRSHLSDRAYRAQWMQGIEVELWEAMHAPNGSRVSHSLTQNEAEQLRTMAETCGGWIAFDHVSGLAFVPMNEWLLRVGGNTRSDGDPRTMV